MPFLLIGLQRDEQRDLAHEDRGTVRMAVRFLGVAQVEARLPDPKDRARVKQK